MKGWIKLHRKLMCGDTFKRLSATQKLIAIYIVLNANHKDSVWFDKYKDIEVNLKRGQLITSRNKIVNEWFKGDREVTEQKVRTTLSKLERLQFLTITSTNNYTLIEVLNYNVYQGSDDDDNQADNQVLTKQQPSTNQVLTTDKNDKNVKNDKKKETLTKIKDLLSYFSSIKDFNKLNKQYWDVVRETRVTNKIAETVIVRVMESWKKYDMIVVEHALKTHIEKAEGKDERYTLGIMRRTTVDEVRKTEPIKEDKKYDKGYKEMTYEEMVEKGMI